MEDTFVPEVRVLPDAQHLAAAVADAFVELLARPGPVEAGWPAYDVALTGGTIARSIHRAIAARAADVDWSSMRFWWGDERFLPRGDPERNAGQAHADFLDALRHMNRPLTAEQIMEVPAADEVGTVQVAAAVYAEQIRNFGTGGFELVMLGVGPDGHVASLFPGHPALTVTDQITVAITDSPKPPPERVSLTFEALERTQNVWFVVSGAEKAEAVCRGLAPAGTIQETPARGVRGRRQTVWWLDAAAASLLE